MSSAANPRRRVAITGMGVVCPLGNSPSAMWEALVAGRSGVDRLSSMPPLEGLVHYGGEASDFTGVIGDFGELSKDVKKSIRKALKVMCRETMMAVAVAQKAVADAGFNGQPLDPERSGVVFGSDYMLSPPDDFTDGMVKCGARENEFQYSHWGQDGLREMNPLWMLKYLPNMPASHIAIMNDLRGPNNSLTLREIAGMMAIREAAQTIERGHADCMIAGATGTRIHSFKTMHAVQTEQLADPTLDPAQASRPFDANRTGMVVGEGSGALVLEELEAARQRGATIYGEIVGTGSSAVTNAEIDDQRKSALVNAASHAMAEARIPADQLGHVNAHGLATTERDAEEAQALGEVLGSVSATVPVVAAKSYFGNLGAGSSVVELVGSLLALQSGSLFKTLNFETSDPSAPLAITTQNDVPAGNSFLKLSVTPQAQAAALVVSRVD
ncbi:MAG: beta-ketoacyl-[acyl-carrier-protein] synthase family protein [Planctomycetes bacterium]|nr:beta-ketoacyl-[acyl-carrier-protein] synthase family protein [Planctomycetota bacterium]